MGLYDETTLFVKTNLGTSFALSISPDITAHDLKGKLGREHCYRFPYIGQIKVHGLMVKKKSFFYHFSDSMLMKYAFEELSGTWLLFLEASLLKNNEEKPKNYSARSAIEHNNSTAISNNVAECFQSRADPNQNNAKPETHSNSCCRKKNDAEWTSSPGFSKHKPKQNTRKHVCGKDKPDLKTTLIEHSMEGKCNTSPSTPTISVTGILSRFFPEVDEMDSCFSQPEDLLGTKLVQDELIDSNIRAMAAQPDHRDNGAAADDAPVIAEVGSKGKKKPNRLRKMPHRSAAAEATTTKLGMNAECSSSKACKHQVGKKVAQAANRVQSTAGRRPANIFLARFGNLKSSSSHLPVRNIAFEFDDSIK